MFSLFKFDRRGLSKRHEDEQRRVMAINVAGHIHQHGLAQNAVSVEKLLETARQVELYVLSGALPAKAGSVLPMQTAAAMRPVA